MNTPHAGYVVQNSGGLSVAGVMEIGNGSGSTVSTSSYIMNGGSLAVGSNLSVGLLGGKGLLSVTGTLYAASSDVYVGGLAGEIDVNNGGALSAGDFPTYTLCRGFQRRRERNCERLRRRHRDRLRLVLSASLSRTATFNQYGGLVTIGHALYRLSNGVYGSGTYNLSGGTLTTRTSPRLLYPRQRWHFNQTGGIVTAGSAI